ncbi:MAG: hypothetical protein WBD08_05245, partial [Candidatus Acidiferrales bacterium]
MNHTAVVRLTLAGNNQVICFNYARGIGFGKTDTPVEREYDIFERFPDGFPVWRGHSSGLLNACLKLQQIANGTINEYFAVYLPTQEIVARLNVQRDGPLVFQIGYHSVLALQRTRVLRRHSYDVVSVLGNEAAKAVLGLPQKYDFFILGHTAPEETRKEMVAWLKAKFPGVPILALNSPDIS